MRGGRIAALVTGCLLVLPALGLLFGGGALAMIYGFGRDDAGYFAVPLGDLQSSTAAITADSPGLTVDLDTPTWVIEMVESDLRFQVTSPDGNTPVFAGAAPTEAVDTYLAGISHDTFVTTDTGRSAAYVRTPGGENAESPVGQDFWTAQSSGTGTLQIEWNTLDEPWSIVVMNADGSPGISAAATLEVKADFLMPFALILFGLGIGFTAAAILLIVVGARRSRDDFSQARPLVGKSGSGSPLQLTAHLDVGLSRWKWLVKWFLAIPHLIVLALLWPAVLISTVIAGIGILFTGRYPRGPFIFNLGYLRWTWRVLYYAGSGGIGTDRYPPFSLDAADCYPATLDITYPAKLSRGLVLVKWWLLAIPHYLIIAAATSNWWSWSSADNQWFGFNPISGAGVLGLLTIAAGLVLLITGRYPAVLFDLIVGFNRWIYRVLAYSMLMTDQYPPFRLDQGGSEPQVSGPLDPSHPPIPVTVS